MGDFFSVPPRSRCLRGVSPMLVGLLTIMFFGLAGCTSAGEGSSDASPKAGAGSGPAESEAATEAPTARLKITDVGGGTEKSLDFIQAAAIIQNPSKGFLVIRVRFAVYDSGGDVLAQEDTYSRARAGATIAVTTPLTVGKKRINKVAKVSARATVDSSEDDPDPAWKLTPGSVKYRKGEYGLHSVTGKVASTYKADLDQAEVTAVCRSSSGKIRGAGVAYVDVGAGATAPVEVDVFGSGIKKCELYPTVGAGTEF